MKRVLFILHEYYPNPSAITNCIEPFIRKFIDNGTSVDVLTRRSSLDLKSKDIIDKVNVYRINDNLSLLNEKYTSSKNIIKLYYKILRKIVWFNYVTFKTNQYGLLDKNKAIKIGEKLFKINKYDAVISCSYPFVTHEIAKKIIKDRQCVWICYQFDPHTYNYTFNQNKIKSRLKQEINVLKNADAIYISKEHYTHNMKTPLEILKDKYRVLEFALIKKQNILSKANNKKIKLVYTGTLYKNIREPFEMLEYLKQSQLDFDFDFYYRADLEIANRLLSYKNNYWNLNLYSNKPKEECDSAINKSDIIVNIGNNISNQLPSKIYEAISTGKPIINFYTIEDDSSKEILSKYPLCLNIKLPNNDINLFDKFCIKNKNIRIEFEQIKKIYKTCDEISTIFVEEVNKLYETKQGKK